MSNLLKDVSLVFQNEEDWVATQNHFSFTKIIKHPERGRNTSFRQKNYIKNDVTGEEVEDDEDVRNIMTELEVLQAQKKNLEDLKDTLKKNILRLKSKQRRNINPSLGSSDIENIRAVDEKTIHFSEDTQKNRKEEKKIGNNINPSYATQKESEQSALFQEFYRAIRPYYAFGVPKELHENVQKALGVGLTPPPSDDDAY